LFLASLAAGDFVAVELTTADYARSWVRQACRTIPAKNSRGATAVGLRPSPTGRGQVALHFGGQLIAAKGRPCELLYLIYGPVSTADDVAAVVGYPAPAQTLQLGQPRPSNDHSLHRQTAEMITQGHRGVSKPWPGKQVARAPQNDRSGAATTPALTTRLAHQADLVHRPSNRASRGM
jgi:hypothetical protein